MLVVWMVHAINSVLIIQKIYENYFAWKLKLIKTKTKLLNNQITDL